MSATVIAKLCKKWTTGGCPTITFDKSQEPEKQVIISDDFGNTIYISKDYFENFIEKAKNGELKI